MKLLTHLFLLLAFLFSTISCKGMIYTIKPPEVMSYTSYRPYDQNIPKSNQITHIILYLSAVRPLK